MSQNGSHPFYLWTGRGFVLRRGRIFFSIAVNALCNASRSNVVLHFDEDELRWRLVETRTGCDLANGKTRSDLRECLNKRLAGLNTSRWRELVARVEESRKPRVIGGNAPVLHVVSVSRDEILQERQPISQELRQMVFDRDEGRCAYCECALLDGWHVDHKHPVSKGGTNDFANLCAACEPCNLAKHDMTAEAFIALRVA